MPVVRSCSRCGKSPAYKVEVALALWNVADADQPTGIILEADACEAHQQAIIEVLQEHTIETLREQAPIHAKAIQHARELAGIQGELSELVPVIKADAARAQAAADSANAKLAAGKPRAVAEHFSDETLAAKHGELLARQAETETRRHDVLKEGNALDTKRKRAIEKALAGK